MLTSLLINNDEPQEIQSADYGVQAIPAPIPCDAVAGCSDGANLFIERKTPSDLLASISDGRLFNQANELREKGKWCYVVIHGRMNWIDGGKVRIDGYRVTGWDWHSVQGALLTVQEMGVGVFQATTYPDAIRILAARDRSDVTVTPRRRSEPLTDAEAIAAAIPGIGPMRAKEGIAKCGSLARFIDLLTNIYEPSAVKINGVTDGLKARTHRIFGLGESEWMTVNEWKKNP